MKSTLFGVITLGILSLTACGEEHDEHTAHHALQRTFQVTSPLQADTVIFKKYVCQVHSSQHIELRALEEGYLQNVFVDEGQHVRKGQLMFQITPTLYQAELKRADAEVQFARIEFENVRLLADSGVVSPNELALAKATLEKAEAERALAQTHLSFTEIRAPFDGLMDHFHVRMGSLLEEGELLTTLSDNSSMWVYFNVPEAEYLEYMSHSEHASDNDLQLKLANGSIFSERGKVTAIEADFNNETGNIAFRATFPNPNRLLRHGQTGNVLMAIPLEGNLLIPQKSTFEVLDKKYVFIVDQEGKLRSRKIEVAAEMPHIYAVSSGLETSDLILLDGLRLVNENDHISYTFQKPDSVLSHLDLYAE